MSNDQLRARVLRLARVHFWLVGSYGVLVLAFDAWKLITPDSLLERWVLLGSLAVVNSFVWYKARVNLKDPAYYKNLVFLLVVFDVVLAATNVFFERGMASRAVMLFAVPITVAAVLATRSALMLSATLSAIAYSLATIGYFVLHPSEGYKVELYGVVFFYCAIFFLLAGLLWSVVRRAKT